MAGPFNARAPTPRPARSPHIPEAQSEPPTAHAKHHGSGTADIRVRRSPRRTGPRTPRTGSRISCRRRGSRTRQTVPLEHRDHKRRQDHQHQEQPLTTPPQPPPGPPILINKIAHPSLLCISRTRMRTARYRPSSGITSGSCWGGRRTGSIRNISRARAETPHPTRCRQIGRPCRSPPRRTDNRS